MSTATRRISYQLETRAPDGPWRRVKSWWTLRTARAHLVDLAENCGSTTDLRIVTYQNGANYYSGDAPTTVEAARSGTH